VRGVTQKSERFARRIGSDQEKLWRLLWVTPSFRGQRAVQIKRQSRRLPRYLETCESTRRAPRVIAWAISEARLKAGVFDTSGYSHGDGLRLTKVHYWSHDVSGLEEELQSAKPGRKRASQIGDEFCGVERALS